MLGPTEWTLMVVPSASCMWARMRSAIGEMAWRCDPAGCPLAACLLLDVWRALQLLDLLPLAGLNPSWGASSRESTAQHSAADSLPGQPRTCHVSVVPCFPAAFLLSQIVSPFQDGLISDWDVANGLLEHALECVRGMGRMHAAGSGSQDRMWVGLDDDCVACNTNFQTQPALPSHPPVCLLPAGSRCG